MTGSAVSGALWICLLLCGSAPLAQTGPAIPTVTVPEGRSVSLICAASKPVSFHEPVLWSVTLRGGSDHTVLSRLEDGSVVKGADDPQNRFSLLDDSSLLISSVKPVDAGLYSCNRQPVADLQVTTVIISMPEGQHLVLNCSDPPPAQGTSVQWTYRRDREGDTQTTDITRKILNTEQKKYRLYTNGSLCIRKVKLNDSGLYYCNSQAVAELEVLGGKPKKTRNSSTVTPGSPNSTKGHSTVTPGSPNSTKDPDTESPSPVLWSAVVAIAAVGAVAGLAAVIWRRSSRRRGGRRNAEHVYDEINHTDTGSHNARAAPQSLYLPPEVPGPPAGGSRSQDSEYAEIQETKLAGKDARAAPQSLYLPPEVPGPPAGGSRSQDSEYAEIQEKV